MSFIIHAWQPLKRFLWIKYSHRYNSHDNVIFYTFIESCQKIFVKRIMAIYEYPAVQHIGSTQGPHLFSTQNPSVQHQKPLSYKPKTWRVIGVRLRGVWNWGVLMWNWGGLGVELRDFGVEMGGFRCWTEEFWVLKRCGPCVEPMCLTKRVCVELRGTQL